MKSITHEDGTVYKVQEVGGSGYFGSRYFVYSDYAYFPVYAYSDAEAIEKFRTAWAKFKGLC